MQDRVRRFTGLAASGRTRICGRLSDNRVRGPLRRCGPRRTRGTPTLLRRGPFVVEAIVFAMGDRGAPAFRDERTAVVR